MPVAPVRLVEDSPLGKAYVADGFIRTLFPMINGVDAEDNVHGGTMEGVIEGPFCCWK